MSYLRNQPLYLDVRWSTREGLPRAWRRRRMQKRILSTPPIFTASSGKIEVRVLTWRRDWINLIWALKSFYHFSGLDYPLYVHDGGLSDSNIPRLLRHFPNAHFVSRAAADSCVSTEFRRRNLHRCLAYRSLNVPSRKLFDFFLMSQADSVIIIDSDIVFFRKPEELCAPREGIHKNLFHMDQQYGYAMEPDELRSSFGIAPVERIACGLGIVKRESVDFEAIERWLEHPKLARDKWLGEQTLHALCSTIYGVELLPPTYKVSTEAGLSPDLVCKHYPGFFRPLLYEEGMRQLVETGFIEDLARHNPAQPRKQTAGVEASL